MPALRTHVTLLIGTLVLSACVERPVGPIEVPEVKASSSEIEAERAAVSTRTTDGPGYGVQRDDVGEYASATRCA